GAGCDPWPQYLASVGGRQRDVLGVAAGAGIRVAGLPCSPRLARARAPVRDRWVDQPTRLRDIDRADSRALPRQGDVPGFGDAPAPRRKRRPRGVWLWKGVRRAGART